MPCDWREESGLRFLYADYRGQTHDQDMATLEQTLTLVAAAEHGTRVLVHVDPNHRPTSEFLTAVKLAMRGPMAAHGVHSAFIGIDGIGRAVIRGLQLVGGGFGAPVFPSREKALEYLARH